MKTAVVRKTQDLCFDSRKNKRFFYTTSRQALRPAQ
jgi:hypothetical protein